MQASSWWKAKETCTTRKIKDRKNNRGCLSNVEKMMSHLLTIKMDQSKLLNKSVQFSTGGPQPLTLTPVTVPRKESDCERTKYDRSKRIRDYIRLSSGDGDEAFTTQTAHVVKRLDETTRKSIVSNVNIKTTIPAEHVAAMKATTKYSLEFIGGSTPYVGNLQCQTFHKKQSSLSCQGMGWAWFEV